MPVVPFIPAIIGAGGAIAGATIASKGATKSAEIQSDASAEALALQKEMFEREHADLAPYRNLGAYSANSLGHLVGMPPGFTAPTTLASLGPSKSSAPTARPTVPMFDDEPKGTGTVPRFDDEVASTVRPPMFDDGQTLAQSLGSSSYVPMQAPNGETSMVAPNEVAFFERHGARRV